MRHRELDVLAGEHDEPEQARRLANARLQGRCIALGHWRIGALVALGCLGNIARYWGTGGGIGAILRTNEALVH